MAFPKDTLLENFSDGKKPTQAQWHQLVDQIRPYNSSAQRNSIINNYKDTLVSGATVNEQIMTNIITQCAIARPFATDYDALKTKFTTGTKPTGADFKTLIDALNYTQLPCVVRFHGTCEFDNATAAEYFGHVLGIHVEASISPNAESGSKVIMLSATSSSGGWAPLDSTSLGTQTPVLGAWLSDVLFSTVTIHVVLASTTQSQKVKSADLFLYMSKTANGANRISIIEGLKATQKDANGLVATRPNVQFTRANYADILGQNAYLFCLATLYTE